ncbi:MAG: arsenate reductase/protein-tyrosine-phosphatase family protein [Candidatus Binatia bacterium]
MRREIRDRNILFLCEDNAQLSQMAEAAAKHLGPPKTRIYSAGIKPGRIPSSVIKAMNEIGVPIADPKSKSIAEVPINEIDLVVSFGDAHKQCANLPGRTKIERWPVTDGFKSKNSEGEDLDAVREERDDIKKRVFALFMDYWRNVA